ncbi:hypothetical protein PTE30175_01158 [Pandoraea terrae]|uniref:Uncharacterized protein n=1 Tax=Pandoraea terrae TaxID=1537710 RepID=A0A5E4TAL4_9BURK|nr:hypothetical protein [Pandoraea terrae]VVD83119.1 hypothetical protein PTE30175_01158 [Pandoraea terrae]
MKICRNGSRYLLPDLQDEQTKGAPFRDQAPSRGTRGQRLTRRQRQDLAQQAFNFVQSSDKPLHPEIAKRLQESTTDAEPPPGSRAQFLHALLSIFNTLSSYNISLNNVTALATPLPNQITGISSPHPHAVSYDQRGTTGSAHPARGARKRRHVPARTIDDRDNVMTVSPADDVKLERLARPILKTHRTWGDALRSIGSGANPFESLVAVANQIHSVAHGQDIPDETRRILDKVGGAIDQTTVMSPNAAISRSFFRSFDTLANVIENKPVSVEKLDQAVNDVDLLRGFAKLNRVSVR